MYFKYGVYIKQYLPPKYQKEINVPIELGLLIFTLLIILAIIRTYHNLRINISKDFYSSIKFARITRIDEAHRIFYHLHKEGELVQHSSTERRQQWDKDIRKAIEEHCNEHCMDTYILKTGRGSAKKETPLLNDNYFKNAMNHILIDHLQNDLKYCIK